MPGIREYAIEVVEGDAAAVIPRRIVGHSLAGEIGCDLEIGDEGCSGIVADLDRIADVVVMTMGEEHVRSASRNRAGVALEERVGGKKGIDHQHGIAGLDPESGVTEIGDFHGLLPKAADYGAFAVFRQAG